MEKKSRFDFNSIRFRLWGYFILFAVIILGLVWLLQIYFLDAFYENMKLREAEKSARILIQEFRSDGSLEDFTNKLNEVVRGTDTYVRVETGDGTVLLTPDYQSYSQPYIYGRETASLRIKLQNSEFSTYSEITTGADQRRTLAYACYLYQDENHGDRAVLSSSIVLYLFSPLFPVESTVSILRTQLIYITAVALLLALSLAIYLATHLSKPIKRITESAAEMGKGNYGVQFKGESYSEVNELAETLTNASRELEKSDMYQKDLIANVSHDLKTPLTMIRSYAEMIRDLSGNNPEKREQHLGVILEEADHLNVLVDDMLTMSRMQQRRIELEMADFDISETIESLLPSYEILSEQEGYKISYKNPGSIMVNGDEGKIKQVLSNLINNAVKYCGTDKEIIINLKKSGRKVRCEVTDHGQGIAPDEISHVWERYYKSSTHHVRPTEGSGLGLSIVKEILSLHKANYGVNSKLGKGSTFWFEMDQVRPTRRLPGVRTN